MDTPSLCRADTSPTETTESSSAAITLTAPIPSPAKNPGSALRSRLFHRILVAVDDSKQASWALDIAAELSVELSARLALVHVIRPPVMGSAPEGMYSSPSLEDAMCEEARLLLQALTKRCPAANPETLLRHGDPADQIIAAADGWNADLIVIGTHGRGTLARLLLGSTAEAVIRRAPCPVLTIALPHAHLYAGHTPDAAEHQPAPKAHAVMS